MSRGCKQHRLRILFVGGYRPFRYRRRGGPNAVSSPLIDMFTLKLPKGVEVTVLSTPFKELALPPCETPHDKT